MCSGMLCSESSNYCRYVLPFDGTPCRDGRVSCEGKQIVYKQQQIVYATVAVVNFVVVWSIRRLGDCCGNGGANSWLRFIYKMEKNSMNNGSNNNLCNLR